MFDFPEFLSFNIQQNDEEKIVQQNFECSDLRNDGLRIL